MKAFVFGFAVLALASTAACAASSGGAGQGSAAEAAETAGAAPAPTTPPSREQLAADIRALYEHDVTTGSSTVLPGESNVDPATLVNDAADDYAEYLQTMQDGLEASGQLIATTAVFEGATLFFVAGDVSDTGTEYGFYDADGKLLAKAYSGQGGHPNAGGVDWMK